MHRQRCNCEIVTQLICLASCGCRCCFERSYNSANSSTLSQTCSLKGQACAVCQLDSDFHGSVAGSSTAFGIGAGGVNAGSSGNRASLHTREAYVIVCVDRLIGYSISGEFQLGTVCLGGVSNTVQSNLLAVEQFSEIGGFQLVAVLISSSIECTRSNRSRLTADGKRKGVGSCRFYDMAQAVQLNREGGQLACIGIGLQHGVGASDAGCAGSSLGQQQTLDVGSAQGIVAGLYGAGGHGAIEQVDAVEVCGIGDRSISSSSWSTSFCRLARSVSLS